MDIIQELQKKKWGKVTPNISMKDYTTYKAGGNAKALIEPDSIENLKQLIEWIKQNKIKYKIIGNGSNLLFSDQLFDGIIIKLTKLDHLKIDGTLVQVGAGYSLMKLALKTAKMGLAGLEFAAGIPGTIGGSVFMNAGAYKSDMGYVVQTVTVLTDKLEIKQLSNQDMDFHYRSSFLQARPDYICIEATLKLRKYDSKTLMEIIQDRKLRRLETQPLEYPSAGSVFRNPEGDFAGRLIEEIGYKGKRIGGACVSEKHANFIINDQNATSNDIKKLVLEIQEKVKQKYGIQLKVEQEYVE